MQTILSLPLPFLSFSLCPSAHPLSLSSLSSSLLPPFLLPSPFLSPTACVYSRVLQTNYRARWASVIFPPSFIAPYYGTLLPLFNLALEPPLECYKLLFDTSFLFDYYSHYRNLQTFQICILIVFAVHDILQIASVFYFFFVISNTDRIRILVSYVDNFFLLYWPLLISFAYSPDSR